MVLNMITLCIYHSPCQDGFASAWAVWKRFGDSVKYHPGMHGQPLPDVTDEHVVLVDFSYKSSIIREMASKAASIIILDHHESAENDLAPLLADGTIKGLFDQSRSGAVITWEYYHPDEPIPQLLLHVQDRDLNQLKLPFTKEITETVFSYPYDFDIWSNLVAECTIDPKDLIREGMTIDRNTQKIIADILTICTRSMVIDGVRVPVANLPYMIGGCAANILAQTAPFGASYYDRVDVRVFSLRSRQDSDVNVSLIAAKFGGGGHFHAAGFQVPYDQLADKGLL
jgi:hypothetical protein